ncbi:DeoR/GlpR family DNA-binding transcription regulator [Kitasatospora sp. NPDC051853]|uniref:DeoR/GlpR family DNA-binding transcription regulator n=1 Tax=Kitasatospora sp. NPDC051853 TaxID=3364058 RepID=UPI0037883706
MADTSNLLAEQRRALILDEVRRRGGVRVNELTQRLGVSDMTIRRDLDALARAGAVEKVHGGAVAAGAALAHEPGFEAKSALEPSAKEQIARAAAALVTPGSAVALSGGTTTYALAQQLVEVEHLTVVTNSVPVSEVFERARRAGTGAGTTVVLTGGVRTPSDALVGPVADRAVRELRFDLLFLGAHGLDAEAGLTTPNLAEAETNRALIASARRTVVVADHTKWGVVGLSAIAPLSAVDTWVTDAALPPAEAALARESIRELVLS